VGGQLPEVGKLTTERDELRGQAAAFEFARQLPDPQFRAVLSAAGWRSGQHVVIALDDEPLGDVLARVLLQARPPAYVAVRRPAADLGFVFLVLVPGVPDPTDDLDADAVGPMATIGMVYDAVRAMHSLTVNDWLRAEAVAY
jgi:hypothetical protein